MLAGLSADYYVRLEQGRNHHPSEHVLRALARALQLDDDATAYLFALARQASHLARSRPTAAEVVSPELLDLVESWTTTAAFVHGRRLDVLAANPLARAVTPVAEPGTNMLRSFFLDHESRQRYDDLETVFVRAVAYFRANVGSDLDDPGVQDLVDELSLESEEFRRVWARHDVQTALSGEDLYFHPTVGPMRLRYQTFVVEGTDAQKLFVVTAAPGTPDARALARLADLTADPVQDTLRNAMRR